MQLRDDLAKHPEPEEEGDGNEPSRAMDSVAVVKRAPLTSVVMKRVLANSDSCQRINLNISLRCQLEQSTKNFWTCLSFPPKFPEKVSTWPSFLVEEHQDGRP